MTPSLLATPLSGQILSEQEIRMKWVTFQTEGGGLLKVQAQHVAAIYDESGS
jgi:hypothetical protein